MENVKFSLTLRSNAMKAEIKNAIIRNLEEKGVRHTASGMTSLSFVCKRDIFQAVFKVSVPDMPGDKTRSHEEIGAIGVLPAREPVVPDDLKESVASVSVSPTARHY